MCPLTGAKTEAHRVHEGLCVSASLWLSWDLGPRLSDSKADFRLSFF